MDLSIGRNRKSLSSSSSRLCFTLLFRALGPLILFALVACQSFPRFTVESFSPYEALFQRTSGWIGGDGAYSAALGGDRFLWLFGDTLLGEVEEGRRVGVRLLSNSVAIQTGMDPGKAALDFFYRALPDQLPAPLVAPEDGVGWLWPYHAVRAADGLYLFLLQLERTERPPPFGFKLVANWLGQVRNPDDPPARWIISQRRIPWGNEQWLFGSFIIDGGDHFYIYGIVEEDTGGRTRKHVILARAPAEGLGDFGAWRFFVNGKWVTEVERAGRICENVAGEFSVSFQPFLRQYAMVYSEEGVSDRIVIRLSPTPYGPWTAPTRIFRCPEAEKDPRLFCYGAKGHPEISMSPEELIITYVVNSKSFDQVRSNAGLYRPRFLRILFMETGQK